MSPDFFWETRDKDQGLVELVLPNDLGNGGGGNSAVAAIRCADRTFAKMNVTVLNTNNTIVAVAGTRRR